MSEILSAAATALGLPEALVKRSAEARAAETGATVDEVLTAWAGGGAIEAAAPPQPETPIEQPVDEPAAEEDDAPAAAPPSQPAAVATAAASPTTAAAARSTPEQVTPREAIRFLEVVTVPTAGIRERTSYTIPRWLNAVILIAPLFALFALGGSATGECGEATELRTDVVTGAIVNCDGTEFTGQSAGGGGGNLIALGQAIYGGSGVTGVNCSTCHGAGGQGSGTFPALTGVLTTFGQCADHIEWVQLGSAGFRSAGRLTYGDTAKPVTQGMPGFLGQLSEEQLAAVVAFERVRFGASDTEETLVDCGLVEAEPAPGDEGSSTTLGEGETTRTTEPATPETTSP